MPALDDILQQEGTALRRQHSWRQPVVTEPAGGAWVIRDGKRLLSFAGNDYLGLSHHIAVIEAGREAAACHGAGSGASRLVSGNHSRVETLEAELAAFKGTEAACIFGSGYLANLGTIPAVVGKGDVILADKLVHACLIDGARLSDATLLRFRHNDMAHLRALIAAHRSRYSRCLILVDGVYSMDGDRAPLDELAKIAAASDAWLMVDDAHGFGVLGGGKGTAHEWNPVPKIDIQVGTFSKAVGGYGGFVSGSRHLIETLHNRARSLIFSTALPPAVIASAYAALQVIGTDTALREKPLNLARCFTQSMQLPEAQSAIVPWIVGESAPALDLAKKAQEAGFYLPAIRPPTVPKSTARLRLTFSAVHEKEDVECLIAFLRTQELPCAL